MLPKKHLAVVVFLLIPQSVDAQKESTGYQERVSVQNETRLDWVFALANQSPAKPPAGWVDDYKSSDQIYELYLPKRRRADRKPLPLVLFISPSESAMGWKSWRAVCEKQGIAFAGPHKAGNNCKIQRRVRIVMDVLDDVRRRVDIDPDRTYISGFSGGGRIACAIGFSLTELFGGVIPICAAGELRQESWLRRRSIDRLSVAMVTGESDFNRGEVERFLAPILRDVGVRTRTWVPSKIGHGMPRAKTLGEVIKWLDDGVKERRACARKFPAARIESDAAPSRESWSSNLLAEAKDRMKNSKTLYSGLMQLKGASVRWPDTPAGVEAKKILLDYDSRDERPWEKEDIAEQRRFLIASARGLDAYASGPLPKQYVKQRSDMAKTAIQLWTIVLKDGQDAEAVEQAKTRIPKLQELLE